MPASVTFTARTRCARCKSPLPVDGLWTVVSCPACNHNQPIPPETWALLLEGVAEDSAPDAPRSLTRTQGGQVWELTWKARKGSPKELRSLPEDVFAEDVFTWPKIGDEGAVARADVVEAIAHRCPSCSAPVQVDGTDRNVTCAGCETTFLLPDPVWARLHPPRDPRPFVLVFDGEARRSAFELIQVTDVLPLPGGDLLVAGQDGSGFALARLDAELGPRWVRKDLKAEDALVAVLPDGRILLVDPRRHAVAVLSSDEGTSLGQLGGKEPEGAVTHHLDAFEAGDLCACADGTFLLHVGDRIVRYDGAGAGVPTWPPATGLFAWLWGTEKPRALFAADRTRNDPPGTGRPGNDRPHAAHLMSPIRMLGLPDGGVVMAGILPPIHAYRPNGTLAWTWELPGTLPFHHRPALAPDGAVWVAVSTETGGSTIWRRGADGRAAQVASSPHYVHGLAPIGPAQAWLFGASGEIWRLQDGAIRARNRGAIDRERYAQEAAEDEPDPEAAW